MSRRGPKEKREKHDAYPTPRWCIRRFLEAWPPPRGRWLEPCAGDGSLIRTVDEMIPGIEWTAAEIRPTCEEALVKIPTVKRVVMGDFLALPREHFDGFDRYPFDVVMTNPPYTRAQAFIDRCRLLAPVLIFLLRLNFLGSEERVNTKMPAWVHVLPNRPQFVHGQSDSCEYGWMIYSDYICTPAARNSGIISRLAVTPLSERRSTDKRKPRAPSKLALRASAALRGGSVS